MAEDLEVGVMLEVDESQLEDVEDRQVGVGGGDGGGDLSPAQQEQQEGLIAGGVSKGLLAVGAIGAILSQLKTVTAAINAVFGAISRSLIPIVEEFADLIRPLIDFANRAGQTGTQAAETSKGIASALAPSIATGGTLAPGFGTRTISEEEAENFSERDPFPVIGGLVDTLTNPSASADLTGEAYKQKTKENLDESQRDKTGSFR